MSEQRMPYVGEPVVYTDSRGGKHAALVTAPWSATCINLVMVSDNEAEQDTYGRQIKRETSCTHASLQTAPNKCNSWEYADVKAPA